MTSERLQEITKKTVGMELSKRHDLDWFSFQDGINPKETAYIIIALIIIALATIGAAAAGWLLANAILETPEYSLASTLFCGGFTGFLVGLFVFDWLITASTGSYEAQMKPVDRPQGWSLAPAVKRNRRLVLSENDKVILQAFARRYPMVKTLAVNEWEGESSPLVFDFISKRDAINRIQQVVIGLDLGTRDGRGGVRVVGDFDTVTIPNWQNGIFEIPPPPNGRRSRDIEVDHE